MDTCNSSAINSQAPNPLTPMAFISPEIARQITVSIYITVGCMSVLSWDILNHLRADYILLTNYTVRAPTVVYFISRWTTLAFVLTVTMFNTAPLGYCAGVEKIANWIYPFAVSSTALLFFFRVRAIFNRSRITVAFFAFMWLAVLAGCLTMPQGIVGTNIGPTEYCTIASFQPYVSAATLIPLVNDTLVFLAISWRLMRNAHAENSLGTKFRTLAFGHYLPSFSKALLQDGQAYYLATVTTSLLTVVLQYLPTVPIVCRTLFSLLNIVLMNIMACRVYRNTKFGIFRESQIARSDALISKAIYPQAVRPTNSLPPLRFRSPVESQSQTRQGDMEVVESNGLKIGTHSEEVYDEDKSIGSPPASPQRKDSIV